LKKWQLAGQADKDITMGQLWVTNSLGGYLSAKNLDKKLRTANQPLAKFRQFCEVQSAIGKNRGETFTWDIISNVATQGGVLVETNTMPETNFTITQGTLTITEAGNSVPFTAKLNDLSEIPITKIINKSLKHDSAKAFDILAEAQFALTPLRVAATGGTSTTAVTLTTDSVCATTNTVAFRKGHVKAIVNVMKERNVTPFIQDDYMCIAWPSTFETLDADLEAINIYVPEGYQKVASGERGRYQNMRFTEQTNIAKAKNGTWGQSKSDWMYFFGDDTVAEGIAVAEEMRGKMPTDYGRSKGFAWSNNKIGLAA
jgi:N4-gp56 family major capsid protein